MISLDAKWFPITWEYKNTLLHNVFEASRLFPLTWGRRMCCLAPRNHTSHYKVEAGSLLFLFSSSHSLISNLRYSFVLQDKNSILSNWAWRQHNAQSLALLYFPMAHKKRKRAIYQTIHRPISISVKHLSLWFGTVTSQIREMKIFITTTWTERRLFEIASSLWHDKSACMCVSVFATSSAALKFLKVWQCYHCNHHTHMVTIPPYGLKYGRRKKKEIWARDNGGKTNKVKLEGGK